MKKTAMKKAYLEAKDFNRLIAATKDFAGTSDRRVCYQYIKIDVDAEKKTATASACNGYMLSVERAKLLEASESFTMYLRPCPKVPAKNIVSLELQGDDAIIRSGRTIYGCEQPKIQDAFLDYNKFFHEVVRFRIAFSAKYLEAALRAAKVSIGDEVRSRPVVFEFQGGQTGPVFLKTGNRRENLKMVLPVRIDDFLCDIPHIPESQA